VCKNTLAIVLPFIYIHFRFTLSLSTLYFFYLPYLNAFRCLCIIHSSLKTFCMLVIAHHFVQNPNFWTTAQRIMAESGVPANMKLHSVFPSKDGNTGTCVWEANSTREVQDWLDSTFRGDARNVTYEVNEEAAIGLPKKSMAAAAL
jgi:hypothetical protein